MNKDQILNRILTEPTELSESQRAAVLSEKDHIRVIAGAGAGKTETLTRKIVYLLMYEDMDPASIVAFTFTEKAAQSMKSRVYERVKQLGGDKACANLGEMYIGTIHGYCFRLLEDYFGYGNYDVFDENQEMAFLLRIGWELGLGNGGRYSDNCKTFLDTINVVYGELIPEETLKKEAEDFSRHLSRYEEILHSHKRLTFNRMIKLAIDNLSSKPEVLDNIRYLIVDEYQDINRAQEKLIQLIGKNAKVFIVGDPRQTIYQWRGSDERCFEEFGANYPEADALPITENRRSGKLILDVANIFADSFERQRYEHLEPTREDDGGVFLVEHERNTDEAKWVADQIEDLIRKNICSYSDIGILFRSVTTSAPVFIDEFRKRDIPFIIGGKVGLFRRGEAQAVGMLFAWLYEDGFWVDNPWNRNDQIRGDDLLEYGLARWQDGVPFYSLGDDVADKLNEWKESVLGSKFNYFTDVYYHLLNILGYLNLDPADTRQAVVMANLGRFSSLLLDYESATILGGRKRDWERDLKGLCWYLSSYAITSYEEQAGDDIRGIDAVQLMTVHQAKGLEWPVVFVPAMVNRRFPSSQVGRPRDWMIPRELFGVAKYEGDLEDERRLFYVALTRARDVLVISYFNRISNKIGQSSFISDLPEDKLTELSTRDTLPPYPIVRGVDTEEIQTFYAGEIINYQRCPHFYRLRELWGYKPVLAPMLGYGNALHYCLRHASELVKNEDYDPLSAIITSVEEHFFLPFASDVMRENAKKGAKKMLKEFVKKHEDDMRRIKEVEARLEFPLQRATVTGKVDVILHDEGNLEIRDYKTSDTVTTLEEASLQVQLYTLGLKMLGQPVTRGSLAFLEDARTEDVGVDESVLQEAKNKTEKHIEGIVKKEFDPCPGDFCEKCDYGSICRWGKRS